MFRRQFNRLRSLSSIGSLPNAAADRIGSLRDKSRRRQELIARELGASSPEELHNLLGPCVSSHAPATVAETTADGRKTFRRRRTSEKKEDANNEARRASGYGGSAAFLKGTQSANPHNDYSQHYVDTGNYPANYIRDPAVGERFAEYPKLNELVRLKDELVAETSTPPMYLKCDLADFDLRKLGTHFDVIIIEPPLEEYFAHGSHVSANQAWSWDQIESLDISSIADARCFIWLWCGASPAGTGSGRRCLAKWGFRRCEDVCWVKTNRRRLRTAHWDPGAVFRRAKEHCLMGIKGTVRRSVDGDFIHANVDMDLIIDEERPPGDHSKPDEIFLIAEHFCLGRRRLHLFGNDNTIRKGWLTVGPALTGSNFDPAVYRSLFDKRPGRTTGCTQRIEALRPKSPERCAPQPSSSGQPAALQTKSGRLKRLQRPAPVQAIGAAHTGRTQGGFVRKVNRLDGGMKWHAPLRRGGMSISGSSIVRKHKHWAIAVQRLHMHNRAAQSNGKRFKR